MNEIKVKATRSVTIASTFATITLISSLSIAQSGAELLNATLNQYCLACHNDALSTANVSFQNIDLSDVSTHGALPEKVLSQLRNRRMPPMEMPKPTEDTYELMKISFFDKICNAIAPATTQLTVSLAEDLPPPL